MEIVKGDTVIRRWGRKKGTRGIVDEVGIRRVFVRWGTSPGRITPILIRYVEKVER